MLLYIIMYVAVRIINISIYFYLILFYKNYLKWFYIFIYIYIEIII